MKLTRRQTLRIAAFPLVAIMAGLFAAACVSASSASTTGTRAATATPLGSPPGLVLGDFEDDYGARFTIAPHQFFQRSRSHFRIVQWNARDQYFVAQNDSLNPSDPGKWTRIDWLPLSGMTPFEWAFCFSAYKAATRAEAEATTTAKRESPKTGCNGFPFSRMKRVTPTPK